MKKKANTIWMAIESTSAPPFYILVVPEGQVRFEFQGAPVLNSVPYDRSVLVRQMDLHIVEGVSHCMDISFAVLMKRIVVLMQC